jgi:hypothetical protein
LDSIPERWFSAAAACACRCAKSRSLASSVPVLDQAQ